MSRARKPISKWADAGQQIPTPGQAPSPAPKAHADATSAELKILQDALDSTTKECRRLTTELEGRQGAHEELIQSKEKALEAAEEKINRIEKELSDAKSAGAKTGDNTYDELIAMRESTEAECKRLQAELTQEKEARAKLDDTLAEKMRRVEALEKESAEQAKQLANLTQVKTKAEEDLATALADLSAGSGSTVEVDLLKKQVAELTQKCDKLEQKRAEAASKVVDLQKELDDLKAQYDGKTAVDSGQYQVIHKLLEELNDLDPTGRGVDDQIVMRIAQKIDELEAAKASAEADLARAGSGDHSAFQAEIDRLNERCTQLERIKDHVLAEKSSAEQASQDLQVKLQEAYDRAHREETRANALEGQLGTTVQERDKAKVFNDDVEKLLVKLDPDTSGPLDKRNDRIIARVDSAVASTKVTPRRAFKEPLVLLALVGVLITGALASYLFVTRAMPTLMGPGVAASASAAASVTVPAEVAEEEAPPAKIQITVQNTVGAPATVPETCYPVSANVVSLFFGQELRDGKIFGRVPSLTAGQKRIKCESDPVYDEVNKQTDVSGCKACVPYEPGTYNASDLMGSIFPQSDATCYVEPTNYRFHSWPSGKSIRFDCGSKDAPYDAVRNCRDVSGCSIIIPDPTAE